MENAHFQRIWHITATIGIYSCTAVAGKLLGLDAFALQTAWGIAVSQMSGITRNFETMTKPLHAGHALEQFSRELRTGAAAAIVQRAKLGFCQRDEPPAVPRGDRRMSNQYEGGRRDE